MRQKGYFFLALLFAMLAAGAVFLYLQQLEQQVKQDVQYLTIPVVGEHIPPHTKITPEMIKTREVPLSQVRSDAFQNGEDITGATARVPLYPGEPLIREKLVFPGDTHAGLSYLVEPGKRAVAIAVNEVIAVGNMLLPGDQVDVLAVLEYKGAEGNFSYATVCVQDLRVLAVGQALSAAGGKVPPGTTVTLEVSPEEGQQLVLAAERGSVRLLLRGTGDDHRTNLQPFTMENYLDNTHLPRGVTNPMLSPTVQGETPMEDPAEVEPSEG